MEKNIGGLDRKIRFFLGALFLLVAFLAPLDMPWRIGMIVIAAIALITAVTSF